MFSDSEEAWSNLLALDTYHRAVDQFCQSSDHESKMDIAFEKGSDSPASIHSTSWRSHENYHQKSVLEIKLLYQDSWQALKVFGRHIYFSWDRRSVQQKKKHPRGATIFIWLILASAFKNSPALRLYLAHVFELIGMNGTAVMMALRNVWDQCVSKSLKQLVNNLKRTFLLTSLKQNQATSSVVLNF